MTWIQLLILFPIIYLVRTRSCARFYLGFAPSLFSAAMCSFDSDLALENRLNCWRTERRKSNVRFDVSRRTRDERLTLRVQAALKALLQDKSHKIITEVQVWIFLRREVPRLPAASCRRRGGRPRAPTTAAAGCGPAPTSAASALQLVPPSTPVEGISRSGMFTHPAGDRTAIVSLKETTFAYGSARRSITNILPDLLDIINPNTFSAVVQQQSRHISLGPSFQFDSRINSDSCQTRQARQRRQPAWRAAHGACRPPRNE
ncbi:hypothetical protein EVAR_87939_1 [Eumeta japonica]|uniref:Uncharacterized protein n=1 Tax=Eumeta variegata TaxID=151549 RepID=A0A4C2A6J6_EUMVA|nr:hypothetical protein EVAR_87939_1 [Eumeta japonica]